MPITIKRIDNFGWPDPVSIPQDTEKSWKLHMLYDDDASPEAILFSDISSLEVADQLNARKGLIKFAKHAQNGVNLCEAYDTKACHNSHEFNYDNTNIVIWRIRQANIRIYFCYLDNRNICVLKIDSKRKDKLDSGEIKALESRAKKTKTASGMLKIKGK